MVCVFCGTDEKKVDYMLTLNDTHVCNKCILVLSKKLNKQLKKDTEDFLKT